MQDTTKVTVNLDGARDIIERCFRAGLVPLLHGSPGVGKSAILHQVADHFNLKVIDLRLSQCDPTDLLGFPTVDKETGKASYAPMDTFPLEDDPIPDGYQGWLLALDELMSAKEAVQAAAYKTIYDKKVGDRRLHPRLMIAGAGNLETDNAIVEPMSTALQSRMIHVEVHLDPEVWTDWAVKNGIDHRITSFIKFQPDALYQFDPDHEDKTYPAPRTWDFASKLIQNEPAITRDLNPVLAGTVGVGMARQFIQYCQVYRQLVTVDQIIKAPQTTAVPDEPSVLYALTGSIANHADSKNIGLLMPFVDRIPKEFQVICLREIVRRKGELLDDAAVVDWCSRNAAALF